MDIWQGRVPRRVVAGFVRNEAFTGNYQRNPFNFPLFNLLIKSVKLLFGGEEYPGPAIYLTEGRDLVAYNSLFKNSGFKVLLCSCGISPRRSTFPKVRGQIMLKGNFSRAPGAVMTLVVYGEFVNILEVDANRVITYDLS